MGISDFINKPYNWPDVSCVSVIEDLSEVACYAGWKALTEPRALARIRQMPGDDFDNYILVHKTAMRWDWDELTHDDHAEFEDDDVVFASVAHGMYATSPLPSGEGNIDYVEWVSNTDWPIAMFRHQGHFYCFVPEVGLKIIREYGNVLCHMRRK